MYEVQTYYGTRRKYFNHLWNAKKYKAKLDEEFDGCTEITEFTEEPDKIVVTED